MSTAIAKQIPWKLPEPLPTRQPPPPSRPEYKAADESEIEQLSTQQKLALLQMSARPSHQAIWRAMREKFDAAPFTGMTFRQLRQLKLAEMLPEAHFHSLTMEGARLCDLIGRQLVADENIHVPWIGGATGTQRAVYCTCGWSASVRLGNNMQLKAMTAHGQHLATVEGMNRIKTALAPKRR